MYERILVPLDGSRFSEEIIPHAKGLAAVHDTPLVLARVADKSTDGDDARDYIDHIAAVHDAQGLCMEGHGGIAFALLQEADREPRTLLAMTSRGRSGLMEIVLGSVAQRVMRGARGPVLLYHPVGARGKTIPPVAPRCVVLPLDGQAHSEAMAADAARFARWLDAELEVVSVVGPISRADVGAASQSELASMETGFVRSKATELGRQHGVRVNWDVLHGDPVEAIVDRVAHRDDVILAMATRHRAALDAAVLGSVAGGCLRRAGVPVLMRLS